MKTKQTNAHKKQGSAACFRDVKRKKKSAISAFNPISLLSRSSEAEKPQAKLNVSARGDRSEQEADTMAERVVQNSATSPVQEFNSGQTQASVQLAEEETQTSLYRVEEEEAQTSIQLAEEEKAQTSIQRAEEEEAQTSIQRAEEKEAQTSIQLVEEEKAQTSIQRAEEEEAQTSIQRAEEEEAQTSIQLAEEEESQPHSIVASRAPPRGLPKVTQKQKSEEEESAKAKKRRTAIQRKETAGPFGSGRVEVVLAESKLSGRQMDSFTRAYMEERMSADFSAVRIHTDDRAAWMCKRLNARAFAHGGHVYFNSGEYDTQSKRGKWLIAHELTHTIQQGVAPQQQHSNTTSLLSKNAAFSQSQKGAGANGSNQNSNTQLLLQNHHGRSQNQPVAQLAKNHESEPGEALSELEETKADGKTFALLDRLHGDTAVNRPHFSRKLPVVNRKAQLRKYSAVPTTGTYAAQRFWISRSNDNNQDEQRSSTGLRGPPKQQYNSAAYRLKKSQNHNITERGPPTAHLQTASSISAEPISSVQTRTALIQRIPFGEDINEYANDVPGWRLLTVIIGYNPLTERNVDRNAKNFLGGIMGLMPGGSRLYDNLEKEGVIDDAFTWLKGKQEDIGLTYNGLKEMCEEAWDEIRLIEGFSYNYNIVKRKVNKLIDMITEFGSSLIEKVVDLLREKMGIPLVNWIKKKTRAYPLLTVILGQDPVTGDNVERTIPAIIKGFLMLTEQGESYWKKLEESQKLTEAIIWLESTIAKYDITPTRIITAFTDLWDALSWKDVLDPIGTFKKIYNAFAQPVKDIVLFTLEVAFKILCLVKDYFLGLLRKHANAIPGYPLLTVILGKCPLTGQVVPRTAKNFIKGFMSFVPGGMEKYKNLEKSGAVDKAFAWLEKEIAKLDLSWAAIKNMFLNAWNLLTIENFLKPVETFGKLMDIFAAPVVRIITFAVNVGLKVLEFMFIGVMGPTGGRVVAILSKAKSTFLTIIKDPIGFLGNLLKALGKGFLQFSSNILKHLLKGLFGWLFGALAGAGLQLPDKFDLKGILSLVLQVLGLTWERIRIKLVKKLDERKVKALEKTFEFVKILVTEGVAGVWKKFLEYVQGLKDKVIDGIRDWVITKIVTIAIQKLVTMSNPVGAVIESILLIYNTVMFFIERLNQILDLVEAIVNSIARIAAGQLAAAANFVEEAMSRTVPVIISFLARLIGLGGISAAIKKIIGKIQGVVDRGVDKLIAWIAKQVKKVLGTKEGATKKEKQQDLKGAEKAATDAMKSSKDSSDLNKKLSAVQRRFNLTKLKIEKVGTPQAELVIKRNPESKLSVANFLGSVRLQGETPHISPFNKKQSVIMGGVTTKDGVQLGATSMDATYLGPNHPKGTATGGRNPQAMSLLMTSLSRRSAYSHRSAYKYVAGHLLNHNIGGPAEVQNLFPITSSANNRHFHSIEQKVVSWVNTDRYWVNYSVKVQNIKATFVDKTKKDPGNKVECDLVCKAYPYDADGSPSNLKLERTIQSRYSVTQEHKKASDLLQTEERRNGRRTQGPASDTSYSGTVETGHGSQPSRRREGDFVIGWSDESNRTAGARDVMRKAIVETTGVSHEQEADRVADQVVGNKQEETAKPLAKVITQPQAKIESRASPRAPPTSATLDSSGSGQPMAKPVQTEMGGRIGTDFNNVRVHTDSSATQMSNDMGARAFTHGNNIYFNQGEYNPSSTSGKHLLAHELTHTIQQGSSQTSIQKKEADNVKSATDPLPVAPVEQPISISFAKVDDPAKGKPEITEKEDEPQKAKGKPLPVEKDPAAAPPKALLEKKPKVKGVGEAVGGKEKPDTGKKGEAKEASSTGSSDEAFLQLTSSTATSIARQYPGFGKVVESRLVNDAKTTEKETPVLVAENTGKPQAHEKTEQQVPEGEEAKVTETAPETGKTKPDLTQHKNKAPPPNPTQNDGLLDQQKSSLFISWFRSRFGGFLGGIATRDNGVNTSAGKRPKVQLSGKADLSRSTKNRSEGDGQAEAEKNTTQTLLKNNDGEKKVQPVAVREENKVLITAAKKKVETKKQDDMQDYLGMDLPENVRQGADTSMAPIFNKSLASERAKVKQGAQKRDVDKKAEVQDAKNKTSEVNKKAKNDQDTEIKTRRLEITSEKKRGREEADKLNDQYKTQADKEQNKTKKDIDKKVQEKEKEAEQHLKDGEKEAEKKKKEEESKAAEKKKELKKAQKKKSWWDRVCDAIKSAVKAITNAIKSIFNALRKAVAAIINAVKKLALAAIEAARKFVIGLLDAFGKFLKTLVNTFLKKLFPELAKRICKYIDQKIDQAKKVVNDIADILKKGVEALANALTKVLNKILSVFETLLTAAVGIAGALLTGDFAEAFRIAIESACSIAGIDSKPIFAFFEKAGNLIGKIFRAPGTFIKNVARAGKKGVTLFKTNIVKHLVTGVIDWLTGAMSDVPIVLPKKFDIKGIFSIVMQVLGLSYNRLRAKLIKEMGPGSEKVIGTIEKGVSFLMEVKNDFPMALWNKMKEKWQDIKNEAKAKIQGTIITEVVKAGIVYLLSMLNPVSAIIKAVIMLYKLIMFVIENKDKIVAFLNSLYNSISQIVSGAIDPAAKSVEKTLARTIPLILALLSKLLGLGGIGKSIQKTLSVIHSKVDKIIDPIIKWVAKQGRKLLAKGKGLVKAGKQKLKNLFTWWTHKEKFKAQDGSSHKLYFEGKETSAKLFVASKKTLYTDFLNNLKVDSSDTKKTSALAEAKKVSKKIDTARGEPIAGKNDVEKKANQQEKATAIQTLMGQLRSHTVFIMGALEQSEDPVYNPSSPNNSKFAQGTVARKLTKIPPKSGAGSTPSMAKHSIYDIIDKRRQGEKGASYYIRGHLLNHNLYGKGEWHNMTPLTREANSTHEKQVESKVKTAVDSGDSVEYKITPNYSGQSGEDALIKEIKEKDVGDAQKLKTKIVKAEKDVPKSMTCAAKSLNKSSSFSITYTVDNTIGRAYSDYQLGTVPKPDPVSISNASLAELTSHNRMTETEANAVIAARKKDKKNFASYAELYTLLKNEKIQAKVEKLQTENLIKLF